MGRYLSLLGHGTATIQVAVAAITITDNEIGRNSTAIDYGTDTELSHILHNAGIGDSMSNPANSKESESDGDINRRINVSL